MRKVKENWLLAIFKKLGETEYIEEETSAPEHVESSFLSDLKKQTAASINSEKETNGKKGGKSGGLKKKYDTPTIEVEEMSQEKLEEMRKKIEKKNKTKEIEIGE